MPKGESDLTAESTFTEDDGVLKLVELNVVCGLCPKERTLNNTDKSVEIKV